MRIKSIFAVSFVILSMACLAQGWNTQGNQSAGTGPLPNVAYPSGPSNSGWASGYGGANQSPSVYQRQPSVMPDHSAGIQGEPAYPYGPYHNPYYDGMVYPRNFLSGTIDWFFSLPSYAIDSFSGFLDNSVFPRVPATSGGSAQPQAQGTYPPSGNAAVSVPLPPASVINGPVQR